jgi:hypothetical protein
MAKSEATTAVPSQNVSTADLEGSIKEEKDVQPVVGEKDTQPVVVVVAKEDGAQPRTSAEPAKATEKKEESAALEEAKALDTEEAEIEYPHGLKLAVITLALCLSVFLVALVSSCATTRQCED